MIRVICLVLMALTSTAHAETLRLAVTTSFHNSGLSEVLLPQIKADTGIEVQLLVVGTGQALRLGAAGDVDAILVHAKEAELAFVADGYGTYRREIMYNDFVIVGPQSDPVGVQNQNAANAAFQAIAAAKAPFVSRGDNSGTHQRELSLWQSGSLNPADFGAWYKEVGSGMGASLNTASALNAYILSDRASWLNFGNKGDLALLFAGDPVLFNQYTFIPIDPARHPHVQAKNVGALENWLTSHAAQSLINGYRINDEQLFTFGTPK